MLAHVQCDYFTHTIRHEQELAVANPGANAWTRKWVDNKPGTLWHVGVMHDKAEEHGFNHHCTLTGTKGAFNEKPDGLGCDCICWEEEG